MGKLWVLTGKFYLLLKYNRHSRYIEDGEVHMWKSGVIFKTQKHTALSEMQAGTKSWIKLTVWGENPKNLLDIFRITLEILSILFDFCDIMHFKNC